MKVIGKDRTSCDVCNPIDEIIARLDALERRASAIVAKVQGIAPDGEGNVTLPSSSSDTDPLHGRVDAFAMSSEVKEAADDAHAYAASIADDVVVLRGDVENLTREVEALDPASVTALEQSVAALQQTVNQLSNLVGGFSAVIRDLEDQMPNKVDRTGDTMTGPLNVMDTATGSRNTQAVNGNRLQNDLDSYAPMMRTSGNQDIYGLKSFHGGAGGDFYRGTRIPSTLGMYKIGRLQAKQPGTTSYMIGGFLYDRAGFSLFHVVFRQQTSGAIEILSNNFSASQKDGRTSLGVSNTDDQLELYVNRKTGNNFQTRIFITFCQRANATLLYDIMTLDEGTVFTPGEYAAEGNIT